MLMRSEQLRVVIFALTGFGNTVLKALLEDARVHVEAVFTVKYDQPFPYYEEQQLIELCDERDVKCYHGVKVYSLEGIRLLHELSPDLIIMATFKQILKKNVIQLPPLGVINFHPSLLPQFRGPCPTTAALLNGEKITGVTVHYVTEDLDEGNILLQRSIDIQEIDNDGQLRQKLASLAGELVPECIDNFVGLTPPVGVPQDHNLVSTAPKPTTEDGYLELATSIDAIQRKMRALNPLPGTSILVGGNRITVERYDILDTFMPDGIYENIESIDISINSQAIKLYKKGDR
jgi:methionyl-tRNA formyltransferase